MDIYPNFRGRERIMAAAKEKSFKLPRYLRLNRGAMWFDTDGEKSSGVKLYAVDTVFVGRGWYPSKDSVLDTYKKTGAAPNIPDIPKDKYSNQNFLNYGYVDADSNKLPWYVDTKEIAPEKLSRLILAFKHGILVEADLDKPPTPVAKVEGEKEFSINQKGERVFVGQNKEIYKKLQNLNFDDLRAFVTTCPKNTTAKNNLIDMFHYEQKGYNRLARPRIEVLDLIRAKLKDFGPTMSAIRVNEDPEEK
jgi:hypothetical protein